MTALDVRLSRLSANHVVSTLADEIAARTGVPVVDITGTTRRTEAVRCRHLLMFEARERGLSASSIARALGMDPSSVAYGIRREAARRGAP